MSEPSDIETVRKALQAIGVSEGYSHDLARRKRQPSDDLAVRIWREAGFKLGRLAGLNDDEIAVFAKARA